MRKVVFAINVSADGACDHTMFSPDDNVLNYFTNLTKMAGALLYGRKTYELMVPYWPNLASKESGETKAENAFARAFVSVPQIIVLSKTLGLSERINTKIIRANVATEIQKLKQEPGGYILAGGVQLPSQLIELGLIDEIHIVVHPLIAGYGRRLFVDLHLQQNLNLKLAGSQVFESGCTALRYLKN